MQFLFADKVEITSDEMSAENMKKEVQFMGHVRIKQEENWIHSDKIIVYFNDNNETKEYKATGNVTFEIKDKKHFYKGHANYITYLPIESKYILKDHAYVNDVLNKRYINGEKIILNMLTGNAKVQGSKEKPVKFIFDMEKSK